MVYILLADGFEEIEALTPVDVLRRCDIEIKMVSITENTLVTGAHGIPVTADITISNVDIQKMDMLILPGGPGHELLDASNEVHALINEAVAGKKYVASICAAPSILGKKGLLSDKEATCFPGYERYLYGARITGGQTATDGIYITAKGAGAAADFAFEIVKKLKDAETAQKVKGMMQYQ